MVNRNVLIVVAVLVIVALGFFFVTNMIGNVITGSVATEEIVENELFRIDEINDPVEEDLNDTQNSSGSK
ncbi:hypothetical protein HN935_00490 [archaeon]|jgi:hypothetical protein|nr:hypothetical protein [archaeon]